jgi:hypothetical protein
MVISLGTVLTRDDPERGRQELRGILGERIVLKPDPSESFLWAEYSLGLQALLPSAEIMVAGARCSGLYRGTTRLKRPERPNVYSTA